jgi:uncharacterized integral membrane protein
MEDQQRREVGKLIGAVVLVAVLVAFVIDNSRSVKVSFIVTDRRVPLIWVLVVTALLGAVADRILRAVWRRRRQGGPTKP